MHIVEHIEISSHQTILLAVQVLLSFHSVSDSDLHRQFLLPHYRCRKSRHVYQAIRISPSHKAGWLQHQNGHMNECSGNYSE